MNIEDKNKRKHWFYLFSLFIIIVFILGPLENWKYVQIILLSLHMIFGFKILIPFSDFKKNRLWRIDICVYGYSLKFVLEIIYVILAIFILSTIIPNDHSLGNNFKFFLIFYFIYGIIFSLLSIDIKKQQNKPERTFWQ